MQLAVEKAGLTTKHFSIFLSTCVSLSLSFFFFFVKTKINSTQKIKALPIHFIFFNQVVNPKSKEC